MENEKKEISENLWAEEMELQPRQREKIMIYYIGLYIRCFSQY